ncbi:hypothetical protein OLEAN_C26330 [Oleispira antarctica RB-8]|uniref:Uncharacterized protein n=1 Tax=Oleispira antarctica RB-8 TaxID=698738 RepID=R4YUL5_OLEAN|nr:hypothetical protein OLEAN_C26330 [Oleispira antarctica RB-8]
MVSKHKYVIAQNPAKFSCACCGDSLLDGRELKQALPQAIYDGIGANTAVTKWAGERMDLGMAVDGLLRVSRIAQSIGS